MDAMGSFDWMVSLLTLTGLELVLGIDNIILLSILVEALPVSQQKKARQLGLTLAVVFRVLLLSTVSWIITLKEPLFTLANRGFSLRDVILIAGGLFLLAKATTEIYHLTEHPQGAPLNVGTDDPTQPESRKFLAIIGQIILFDMIFSLDSVLTAVGLTENLTIMIIAVLLATALMLVFAQRIGEFVHKNPALKMLALAFLAMIGVLLMAEGFGSHFDKGYIYFAMAFSLVIEVLNRRRDKKHRPS